MSRYFARLVQRAAGVEQRTHAAPSPWAAVLTSAASIPPSLSFAPLGDLHASPENEALKIADTSVL